MSDVRVVISGVGLATPVGHTLDALTNALHEGTCGIVKMPQWEDIGRLDCKVAGAIEDLDFRDRWPRKKSRTFGRVAELATHATELALADAGLADQDLGGDDVGLAYGSTAGSTTAQEEFLRLIFDNHSFAGVGSSNYLKFMSHTCAANLAMFFGIHGRVLSTCAACVSGSQAVGMGFETIRSGRASVMVCGGAEELHYFNAGVFDVLYATSTSFNDNPEGASAPFDRDRDGLVVAEGAGTVIVESLERAQARGAKIYAEILGYGTTCDGAHPTAPSVDGMARALELSLKDARLSASDIDYVNAHATATQVGDICESEATHRVLGTIPVSSSKGHLGHTLGACGAIELVGCLGMMRDGFMAPTRNLKHVDPKCADLDYVMDGPRPATLDTVMTNNFAFGGINTSLVVRRF